MEQSKVRRSAVVWVVVGLVLGLFLSWVGGRTVLAGPGDWTSHMMPMMGQMMGGMTPVQMQQMMSSCMSHMGLSPAQQPGPAAPGAL